MPENRFVDVRRFKSIDSTNRYLLDEARAGAPEGLVAVTDHQTAGRGRLGRSWLAPAGANLLLSVLLRPVIDPGSRYLVTTAVALAAVDAIAVAGGTTVGSIDPDGIGTIGIKWPNDLVAFDGRKLAGVLAEADLPPGVPGAPGVPVAPVVVGIGINVNWPATDDDLSPELRGAAVSLRQLVDGPVDREALLEAVLAALEPRTAALSTPSGRAQLAHDLRAKCTTLGTRIRVDLPEGSFEGTAIEVTDEGHLTVDADGIHRTVVAGDVVHIRPGS
jgi:BirA family biotin operon repressor/biotin-[acetyl-CoA-carboxylase] ligase